MKPYYPKQTRRLSEIATLPGLELQVGDKVYMQGDNFRVYTVKHLYSVRDGCDIMLSSTHGYWHGYTKYILWQPLLKRWECLKT